MVEGIENIEDQSFFSQMQEYAASSSIHGLGQLSKSRRVLSILIWTFTVASGIGLSCFMVYNSVETWEESPVITSVAQIPIESIVFPPVTICPIENQDEADEHSANWTVKDLVLTCIFTKNGWDTKKVCDRIQKISNENGDCMTFNNVDIVLQQSAGPVKVPGVGEQNSLRLVLGSQLNNKPVKYKVFISEAGTTISKVFFEVDPTYQGEQTFFLHGIHYVQAGKGFKEWNENKKACYFPKQRQLRFFKAYLQNNCQRECLWNKTIQICGCAPKMLNHPEAEICIEKSKVCWEDRKNILTIEDESKCNCKTNCEMTHFFYSLRKEPLATNTSNFFFFFDTHIITQINLELKHTFFDKMSAIGGTFGLFCGLSIISGVEFLFYLGIMISGFIKKKICNVGNLEPFLTNVEPSQTKIESFQT